MESLKNPGYRCGDPGDRCRDPGDRCIDPGDRCRDPGYRFRDPGDRCIDPGDRCMDPGDRLSQTDVNTNAITEEERRQQLAKLNLNVDESVTVKASQDEVLDTKVNGTFDSKENVDTPVRSDETNSNENPESESSSQNNEIKSKEIPNEIIEDIANDISSGVVKDFSQNIANYVTEVNKFDQQYEREQEKAGADKDSNSSVSENTDNSPEEQTNSQTDTKEETVSDTGQTETTTVNPEEVKENDVKDKCFEKEGKKKEVGDDNGYLDLLGNGLLKRKVIEGHDVEDIKPYHGDLVTISTEGTLEDGTVVDKFDEITFPVGEGDVIQAWDLGVMTTKVGQTIELISAAKYAYGDIGRKPDIPANASLTYKIKLIKKEEAPEVSKLDINQRFDTAEKKRERGNELFGRNDYAGAINSYNRAIKILESGALDGTPEKLQSLSDCRLKCCNNMAACQLKVEAYDAAIKSCESVLQLQPENVKALFRMGKAHTAKSNTKIGIQYLQKALKLEPDSKVIKQELKKLSLKLSKETELERDMYKKMLGTKTKSQTSTSQPTQKSWTWTLLGGAVAAAVVATGLAAYRYGHH